MTAATPGRVVAQGMGQGLELAKELAKELARNWQCSRKELLPRGGIDRELTPRGEIDAQRRNGQGIDAQLRSSQANLVSYMHATLHSSWYLQGEK